jgi:drug/metabolite transporter (DMT)-like permease
MLGAGVIGLSDTCQFEAGLRCPPLAEFVQGKAFWGDLLAIVGALGAAGYVMIGRNLRAKTPVILYIFIVYGIAALALTGLAIGTGQNLHGFSPKTYLWLILIALGPQLLGHTSVNWALGFLPAAFVAITLLGEPIGSIVLAYVFLEELPSLVKLFGAILILSGIVIASQRGKMPEGE